MQQDVEMHANPTTLKDRTMKPIYTMIYSLTLGIGVCFAAVMNAPAKMPETWRVVFVDTYYTEQISVPRAPTLLESIEALQITLDGGYESLKYRALTQITSPPTPARKPRGV